MIPARSGTVTTIALVSALAWIAPISNSLAGSIGDPTSRFWDRGYSLGFDYDFTIRPVLIAGQKGDVDVTSYQMTGAIGLWDRVSAFAKFGIGRVADRDAGLFFSDMKLAYGGGVKVKLLDWEGIRIGGGGQYSEYNAGETATGNKPGLQIDVYWREVEGFGGVAYDGLRWFTPYVGAVYSDVYGKRKESFMATPLPRQKIDEQNPLGIYFGVSARPRPWILLIGEGRLVNQTSFTFSAAYLF